MNTEEQPANLDIMKEQVLDLVVIMKILSGYKFISLVVFFSLLQPVPGNNESSQESAVVVHPAKAAPLS